MAIKTAICPECEGRGYIMRAKPAIGRGELVWGETCTCCDGLGYIKESMETPRLCPLLMVAAAALGTRAKDPERLGLCPGMECMFYRPDTGCAISGQKTAEEATQ